jgi:hypothetical protein
MEYKEMRDRYMPKILRAIFILESPPKSGAYFYNSAGSVKEQLFKAFMQFAKIEHKNKEEGLCQFQSRGFLVVDASYEPVNNLKEKDRENKILENYELLLHDLSQLNPDKSVPLVLVKKNVCELLEPRLKNKGFIVANNGVSLPFPGTGRQRDFRERIMPIAASLGID